MANPDFAVLEGFDNITGTGDDSLTIDTLLQRKWPNVSGTSANYLIRASLLGPGRSMRCAKIGGNANAGEYRWRAVPGNYARSIGTFTFGANVPDGCNGVIFMDGTSVQLSFGVNSAGNIQVRRGDLNAAVIATSTQVANLALVNNISWDITFHNSTGIIKIWLNGVLTSLNLTGQDTCSTANNYVNGLGFGFYYTSASTARYLDLDHWFAAFYTASGGAEVPPLDSPVIESQVGTTDDTGTFTAAATALGDNFRTTTATNAPGANQLVLRKFTPEVNMTLNSVSIMPAATSAGAKQKAVLYSDTGGSPDALVATGTEVTGLTSGTAAALPFAAGQNLTGGTAYWIGYITDTSVALQQVDSTTNVGQRKANTYSGGAPNPAGAMTGAQASWRIWGNCTAATANYAQLNATEPTTAEYNESATATQKSLLNFPALVINPTTIHAVAVEAAAVRSDGGARTLNLITKSGATTSNGSLAGQAPALSGVSYLQSLFYTDPNTGAAWANAAAVNAAKSGYEAA